MESDTHLPYFTKVSGKSQDFYFLVGIHLKAWDAELGCKDHFDYVPSQLKMTLQWNVISHWLGAYTKWSLGMGITHLISRFYIDAYVCIFMLLTNVKYEWYFGNSANTSAFIVPLQQLIHMIEIYRRWPLFADVWLLNASVICFHVYLYFIIYCKSLI